jgi:RimJ/RimL family protein N-acetyltransferase
VTVDASDSIERMLALEPLGPRHLPAVDDLVLDRDVIRFTRIPDPPPSGFTAQWIAGYESGRRDGTREGFAIVDDGRFAGLALAPTIDREARQTELGYVVAPHARGRGVATWALGTLTDWAFGELDVLRIELFISVENGASKRVAERCRYTREGVLRSLHVKQGLREDTELWSRLSTD